MAASTSVIRPSVIRPMALTRSRRRRSRSSGVRLRFDHSQISTNRATETRTAAATQIGGAKSLPYSRFLKDLLIIGQERRQALVSERMVEEHVEHLERHGGDMGAG